MEMSEAVQKANDVRKSSLDSVEMDLWNSWCKTDPAITKGFKGKGGFRGTAIDAQQQIKLATGKWGPMGMYWGVKGEVFAPIVLAPDTDSEMPPFRKMTYAAILFYGEAELPIHSDIDLYIWSSTYKKWSINNDVYKKVSTDALTKGLSRLGMNSDVFEGKFDDNKYVQDMKESFANKDSSGRPTAAAPIEPTCEPDPISGPSDEGMFA